MQLLAPDAVVLSDGGGKAKAALAPILGADRVARFFLGLMKKAPAEHGVSPGARQRPARADDGRSAARSTTS